MVVVVAKGKKKAPANSKGRAKSTGKRTVLTLGCNQIGKDEMRRIQSIVTSGKKLMDAMRKIHRSPKRNVVISTNGGIMRQMCAKSNTTTKGKKGKKKTTRRTSDENGGGRNQKSSKRRGRRKGAWRIERFVKKPARK